MLVKEDLKINGSVYYKKFTNKRPVKEYLVSKLDEGDPGRITMRTGFDFSTWPMILRLNTVIDPFEDIEAGNIVFIPDREDLTGI